MPDRIFEMRFIEALSKFDVYYPFFKARKMVIRVTDFMY